MKQLKAVLQNRHNGLRVVANLVLMITMLNATTRCVFIFHQPDKPETLLKLRKY